MDQPDTLAVKLNTRDRKGLGSQPRTRPNAQFYHLQRDQPPSVTALARPAPACDKLNHRVPSPAKGCAASAAVPCGAALAWRPSLAPALAPEDAPPLGGRRQRGHPAVWKALAPERLPLRFQSCTADLREHLEHLWARAVLRAASQGPCGWGNRPMGSGRQWSVRRGAAAVIS